jgi:hypothetical protein
MDYSGDEGDEGMWDWPPHANRVVEKSSASDSSIDDDEGELGEYPTSPVHRGSVSAVMGGCLGKTGGPLNLR